MKNVRKPCAGGLFIMEYLAATFTISCPDGLMQTARDLLADASAEAGFESFEDTDNGLNGYVQKSLFNQDALDEAIADFPLEKTTISYSLADAENKDWNETWEESGFEPISIDDKIIIEDSNHNPQTSNIKPQRILIDAKLAFGTGNHETTRMIISTLLGMELRDKRVLDCGCGTGILGITASKLGAKEIAGYDIDQWSVDNSQHNAKLNGVDNMTVLLGDVSVLKSIGGEFDIVIANINRNILLNDMPAMADKLASGGQIIFSGFYEEDLPMLSDKAASLELSLKDSRTENRWCCAVFCG